MHLSARTEEARPGYRLAAQWLTAFVFFLLLAAFALSSRQVRHHAQYGLPLSIQFILLRADITRYGLALLALCSYPLWHGRLLRFTERIGKVGERVILGLTALFLFAFIYLFGRWQFGAYDFQIVIDTAWRQYIGQRPYTDYLASAPPGFDLGLRFAFQLFGPSWNAVLLLAGGFAALTFVWTDWLLQRLGCGRVVAWLTAFALQSSTSLLLCFWWYNNTAMLAAAVFLLSCGLFLRERIENRDRISLVLSTAMLVTMKPNFAGLAVLGGVGTLLLASRRRLEVVGWTALGTALAAATLLLFRISPVAMLSAYRGVSKERGVLSSWGLDHMGPVETQYAWISFGVLCVPLVLLLVWTLKQHRLFSRRTAVAVGFSVTAVVVAIYGLRTNGEMADLEWTAMLLVIGWLVAGSTMLPRPLRSVAAALLFGFAVANTYQGARRIRIFYVGQTRFWEENDTHNRLGAGLLRGMNVSRTLVVEQHEAQAAMQRWDGPYFFGPRIDFSYAEYGLVSPPHFPAWFHPGTAFDRAQMPQVLDTWQRDHFHTLIFSRDDYSYYPAEFLQRIARDYVPVQQAETLTVWRAKPELLSDPSFTSPEGAGLPVRR